MGRHRQSTRRRELLLQQSPSPRSTPARRNASPPVSSGACVIPWQPISNPCSRAQPAPPRPASASAAIPVARLGQSLVPPRCPATQKTVAGKPRSASRSGAAIAGDARDAVVERDRHRRVARARRRAASRRAPTPSRHAHPTSSDADRGERQTTAGSTKSGPSPSLDRVVGEDESAIHAGTASRTTPSLRSRASAIASR